MNGVVFDFDGVLADSEPLQVAAWAAALAPHGITIDEDDVVATTGANSRDTYDHYRGQASLPSFAEVMDLVDAHSRASYGTELRGFDDAIEAVRILAGAGVPLAIASSSSRMNLDLKLAALNIGRYFDVTVAGDEVPHSKPAPDLYVAAAKALAIDVSTSVAVEDNAIGADAATAAGLRTVIVKRMDLPTGHHTVVSHVDADLLLLWLGRA